MELLWGYKNNKHHRRVIEHFILQGTWHPTSMNGFLILVLIYVSNVISQIDRF